MSLSRCTDRIHVTDSEVYVDSVLLIPVRRYFLLSEWWFLEHLVSTYKSTCLERGIPILAGWPGREPGLISRLWLRTPC